MEARSAKVSIPGVEGCLKDRTPFAAPVVGVEAALLRTPEVGLRVTGDAADRCVFKTALCGSVGKK